MWLSQGSAIKPPSIRTATQATEGLWVTSRNGLKSNAKHRGLQREHRWSHRRSPQFNRQERSWRLVPTVIFWWYGVFILCRMEGHNLHYADKSIKHEQNSSQNSKTRLFDLRIPTVHSVPLSSQQSALLHWVGPRQRSQRSSSLSSARRSRKTPMPPSWGKYRHTHRRCGLVMISRDYGWLMVGKYIRSHRLREGEGISLTLADLHWSTANEWGLAASSYLPTDK